MCTLLFQLLGVRQSFKAFAFIGVNSRRQLALLKCCIISGTTSYQGQISQC